MRILVVNPNTSEGVTKGIHQRAKAIAGPGTVIASVTAPFGAAYISSRSENVIAAHATLDALARASLEATIDGAVIGAFTDTGLLAAREIFPFPVVGMVEAGMAAASRGGRRFAVITILPPMTTIVNGLAVEYGHSDLFAGAFSLDLGKTDLLGDLRGAVGNLSALAEKVARAHGAEAILLGGAPLAPLAEEIAGNVSVPVLEGIGEAVRRLEDGNVPIRIGPIVRQSGKPCKGITPELANCIGLIPTSQKPSRRKGGA